MNNIPQIISIVEKIYRWIDAHTTAPGRCLACGACCDFPAYDHRLFVTTPELVYFRSKIGTENIKPVLTGICPYNARGKCSVYAYRFASCRIFSCRADHDLQSRLSETSLHKLKTICRDFGLDYQYLELHTGLDRLRDP